jgi:single-strand DNA-binding protein
MASLNKTYSLGNLAKEPDYRDFGNGKGGVCTLRIAMSRKFKNGSGQEQEETCFADVEVYGKTATSCRQFLSKGSKVLVEGRLVLKQWEKEGRQYSKLMIAAENIQFLSSRKDSQSNPPRPPADHPQGRNFNPGVDPAYAPEIPDSNSQYADDDCPF